MSRVLCSKSGIEFKVEHFAISLSSREMHHPVFELDTPALLSLSDRYWEDKMTEVEGYLYYLALLNSSNLVDFRNPAIRTGETTRIVASNMERLLALAELLHTIGTNQAQTVICLPRFVVSTDSGTHDLSASTDWLKIWKANYTDWRNNYKTSTTLEKLARYETILERNIKDRNKDLSKYISYLSNWAMIAGDFPTCPAGLDKSILGGRPMSLSDYWCYIIKACAKLESIWEIPAEDIKELIEHCEEHIEHGSIYAETLMTTLREGYSKKTAYINLGDIDIGASGTTFRILDADSSVEDANKIAMIDSAPLEKPQLHMYPNKLAFLRAKAKWDMKVAYENSREQSAVNRVNTES